MLRKLYSLVSGASCADNPDSPQHQEVLLPGFLYSMIIKERFDECLNGIRAQVMQDIRRKKVGDFFDSEYRSRGYLAKTYVRFRQILLNRLAKDQL
jgi:DNA-directed RNA polymerase I subunit RPA2